MLTVNEKGNPPKCQCEPRTVIKCPPEFWETKIPALSAETWKVLPEVRNIAGRKGLTKVPRITLKLEGPFSN